MKLNPVHFHARDKWHTFSKQPPPSPANRQKQFLQGVPLVLIPAVFAFPAWLFLVRQPRFPNAHIVAGFVFPILIAMAAIGTYKLVRCIRWPELDLIGALSFGMLLVLFAMVLYGCALFLALYLGDLGRVG